MLLFALATTLAAGLLCGASQAWQASRAGTNDALKLAGRGTTGRGRRRLGHVLVVVEFALSMTLLAGAGLTIVSFWNRMQVDLGVRIDRVLTFALPVGEQRQSSPEQIETFYRQLLERFEAVPGVVGASISAPGLPLLSTGLLRQFSIAGRPEDQPSLRPSAGLQMVSPGFFETFGIRLVRGRALTAADGPAAQRVAVVNERFVERFLAGSDPLGQRLLLDRVAPGTPGLGPGAGVPGPALEWHIVGVFGDVNNVERFGDSEAPQIYVPFAQQPWPQPMAAVRVATSVDAVRRSLAAEAQAVDPDLPLTDVRTMEEIVGEQLAPDRLNVALYGGLALLALVLAAVGIHGVMAYTVAQRTGEIGLRMALGAEQTHVRRQILAQGAVLACTGLVLGLVGSYALGRAMQSTLYGTGALSAPVVIAAGVALFAAALVACYVPARRASAVDPLIALRQA